jgi:hypothetical protein
MALAIKHIGRHKPFLDKRHGYLFTLLLKTFRHGIFQQQPVQLLRVERGKCVKIAQRTQLRKRRV